MPNFQRTATIRTLVLFAMCLGVLIAQIDTSVDGRAMGLPQGVNIY